MSLTTELPEYKFVVLLNKKLQPGVVLNATAHMVAALLSRAEITDREKMKFLEYQDADGQIHPVSGLSLIVLRANNSSKIRAARQCAIDSNILCVDFTESMTGASFVEQIQRTQGLAEADLEYYGLCMFGAKPEIDAVTSSFSLWR